METYKSLNVDFHGGNLIEHSTWTALFTEQWLQNNHFWTVKIPKSLYKLSVFCAFIHDIGKIQKFKEYYNIPSHPHNGKNLLLSNNPTVVFSNNTKELINIKSIFKELGFNKEDHIKLGAFVSTLHWEFGNLIKTNGDPKKYISLCKSEFKKLKFDSFNFSNAVNILILVSVADIKASQQFIDLESLRQKKNAKSTYFKWLTNRPKIWPGKNAYKDFAIEAKGKKLKSIIDTLLD